MRGGSNNMKNIVGILVCILLITTIIPIIALAGEPENPEVVFSVTDKNIEKPLLPISRDNWLYVGGIGPGNYSKIQDAINDSFDGDTVFVFYGMYYENLKVYKAIRILGQRWDLTIIDGGGIGSVVTIGANVTISGFTIQNSGRVYSYDAGIKTQNQPDMSYVFIVSENCIKNNKNGIYIRNSQNHIITRNTFMNNEQAIFVYLTSDCNINNNNFINNTNHCFFEYFIFIQKHPCNNWNKNYWDDWHSVLPRPIQGHKEWVVFILRPGTIYMIPFPWINFDWHPAKTPYRLL